MFGMYKILNKACIPLFFILCVLICLRISYFGNSANFGPAILYRPVLYQNIEESEQTPNLSEVVVASDKGNQTKKNTELNSVIKGRTQNTNVVDRDGNVSLKGSLNCSKKELTFSQRVLPITGLVSFPGSGNTWTRHLIQQMTGLGTSSVYCDKGLRARGFPYECHLDKARTVVVKTHESQHFSLFKKIVLLVRNPYDALLSYVNFAKIGHTGRLSKQPLIEASNKMFEHSVQWYVNLTRDTIEKFEGPVHVVQYERLQADMAYELRKLASFFDLSVPDKDIDCAVKLQEGNFHRKTSKERQIELLRAVYTKEKLLRLQEAARYCEKLIKDAYDIDIDLGGTTEKLLFQSSLCNSGESYRDCVDITNGTIITA